VTLVKVDDAEFGEVTMQGVFPSCPTRPAAFAARHRSPSARIPPTSCGAGSAARPDAAFAPLPDFVNDVPHAKGGAFPTPTASTPFSHSRRLLAVSNTMAMRR
jgi:hypothetical protein